MIKLIAIDLDGTLIDSYGHISEKDIEAIKYARSKGVEVVLASGRPVQSVANYSEDTGSSKYVICGNGAILYDLKNENILYSNSIEKTKVGQIEEICDKNSIAYQVITEDEILVKGFDYATQFFNSENARLPENKKTKIHMLDNIFEYIVENDKTPLKITIANDDKIITQSIINNYLKSIRDIEIMNTSHETRKKIVDGTEVTTISFYYCEITNKNVNKWEAVKSLAEYINVRESEIMCIGDNFNDMAMIKNAGVGVAMGESAPDVKQIADFVTYDNDNSGVANAIYKYIS